MTASLEKRKREFVRLVMQQQIAAKNAAYGQFIIQTNEVQYKLAFIVFIYSSFPEKSHMDYLFGKTTFGPLIGLFQSCAPKNPEMYQLLRNLKEYKKLRDQLAHRMYSSERLTHPGCKAAITIGKRILRLMDKTIESFRAQLHNPHT